jgi:ribosomal protein S18 acetylase RimI-like enzyme
MKNTDRIHYKVLNMDDLNSSILTNFNRYQNTNRVWYKENNQYKLKADHFIEQWNTEKKALVILDLQNCIRSGGIVVAAIVKGKLIGFACVEGALFGTNNEYRELSYIHVTYECRGIGIGKQMFEICCKQATHLGTKKLYIAAHPSEETQNFYRSLGCTYAVVINQKIYNKEPLDIQLEYIL